MTPEEYNKIIDEYKIQVYQQKLLIEQLKNKLYYKEQVISYYYHKINIISKL